MLTTWARTGIQSAKERSEEFERHMADSYRRAYTIAYRMTGNSADAEDLLQETFTRAFKFFHRYDRSMPFTSWLFRIMTNLHIDISRKDARLRCVSLDGDPVNGQHPIDVADAASSPEQSLMSQTMVEPIQVGLSALNPEFRAAVLMADVEGMTYEEIAEVMGTSVGTVRSRIHRGRKQLRHHLEPKLSGGLV